MKEVIFVLLNGFADWEGAFTAICLNQGVKPGNPINYKVKYLSITKEIVTSIMGLSAKQYIQNKVMDESKRLLAYTDSSISDIAFELHFSTVSYFIRCFRQHTGETPLLYRKTHKP